MLDVAITFALNTPCTCLEYAQKTEEAIGADYEKYLENRVYSREYQIR